MSESTGQIGLYWIELDHRLSFVMETAVQEYRLKVQQSDHVMRPFAADDFVRSHACLAK